MTCTVHIQDEKYLKNENRPAGPSRGAGLQRVRCKRNMEVNAKLKPLTRTNRKYETRNTKQISNHQNSNDPNKKKLIPAQIPMNHFAADLFKGLDKLLFFSSLPGLPAFLWSSL
jgi:hypothetical protein